MKIAITGHTKGIGKSIADVFEKNGHNLIGFSRSNGYDIGDPVVRQRILKESADCDVFINNAFHHEGQYLLLENIVNKWDNTNKLIININSKIKFLGKTGEELFLSMMSDPNFFKLYIDSKRKQDILTKSRLTIGKPQILDISPGVVDTDMGKLFDSRKLNPDDVAEIIYYATSIRDKVSIRELVLDVPGLMWSDLIPTKVPNLIS